MSLFIRRIHKLLAPALVFYLASIPIVKAAPSQLALQTSTKSELKQALHLFDNAQYGRALQQLEALYAKPHKNEEQAEVIFYLARSYFKDRQVERAHRLFTKCINLQPKHADCHFLLGSVSITLASEVSWWKKLGMARQAIKSWEDAIRLEPNSAEARYFIATVNIFLGNLNKVDEQLKILENHQTGYHTLVKAFLATDQDDVADAEKFYRAAIDSIPGRVSPRFLFAEFLLRNERFEDALEMLDQYRAKTKNWADPDDSRVEFLTGRIYKAQQRPTEARQALELGLSLNPYKSIKRQIEKELKALGS